MMKAVTNLTGDAQTIAGIEIAPSSQVTVREELISQDELTSLAKSGCVISFSTDTITIKEKDTLEDGDIDEDVDEDNTSVVLKAEDCKLYPLSLITESGNLTKRQDAKEDISKLKEEYGEHLLTDREFVELFPMANMEEHRIGE